MRLSRTITAANRAEIARLVELAPEGSQVEIMTDPRTLAQNRLLWRLLSRIAEQVEHCGQHWEPDDWRACFLKAMGAKLRFMPSLDGDGVVAIGYRSSKLDKAKFSELIEFVYSEGAKRGVDFDDPPQKRVA